MAKITKLLEAHFDIMKFVKQIKDPDGDIHISVKKVGSDHVFAIQETGGSGFSDLTIAIVRGGSDQEFINEIRDINPADDEAIVQLQDALSSYTYVEF